MFARSKRTGSTTTLKDDVKIYKHVNAENRCSLSETNDRNADDNKRTESTPKRRQTILVIAIHKRYQHGNAEYRCVGKRLPMISSSDVDEQTNWEYNNFTRQRRKTIQTCKCGKSL